MKRGRKMDLVQKVEVCAKTDTGFKRKKNEDRYLILDDETEFFNIKHYGRLYALADGMGGHAGGEVASKMACKGMTDYYSKTTNDSNGNDYIRARLQHLKSTFYAIHNKIIEYGQVTKEYEDMGTTLSVLVLLKNKALIAHVGDSRIYRLRGNFLEQLTEDHTFAQIFLQKGYITPKVASEHPIRHVMTQAVGQGIEDIFLKIEMVEKGDIFLLCSDGLHDMLSDVEIKNVLSKSYALKDKCNRLIAKALEMGGKDNVTVIVIQV
jgi:serine/threonine protein phosphatase PrpC